MGTITILELIQGVLAGIPEALAVWNQMQAMLAAATDPTPQQFADLHTAMDTAEKALAGPTP